MASNNTQPSDQELQILSLLWRGGPMTARQVLEAMPDGKRRAYTSILSVLQVMEKKKLVAHERGQSGLAYIYRPTVAKKKVLGPLMKKIVQGVFGGDPATAIQQMLDETPIDQQQIDEIRQMLDELDGNDSPRGKK